MAKKKPSNVASGSRQNKYKNQNTELTATTSGSRQNKSKNQNTELTVTPSGENVSKKRKGREVSVTSPTAKKQLIVEDKAEEVYFYSRMSPSGLHKFLTHPLSPQQVTSIKSIGFGSLFHLHTDVVPSSLPPWLVSTFDVYKCALMNGKLEIDDIDIHLATGLPMGPVDIDLASTACHDKVFKSVKTNWLSQFGKCSKVKKQAVYDKMIAQVEGGDEFKRNFIVYVVSTFLMGVKGEIASA